jgi:CxxC motif-containing protein (DUF1111 family)
LAGGISQGVAGGDEFRTAPLWGLGQRILRTKTLVICDSLLALPFHRDLF